MKLARAMIAPFAKAPQESPDARCSFVSSRRFMSSETLNPSHLSYRCIGEWMRSAKVSLERAPGNFTCAAESVVVVWGVTCQDPPWLLFKQLAVMVLLFFVAVELAHGRTPMRCPRSLSK